MLCYMPKEVGIIIVYRPMYCVFCCAMLCISAAYAVMRCLSVCVCVCPSVTFVDSFEMGNHTVTLFSPSGTQALVFPYQTSWHYSDGDPPNRGVEGNGV